MKDKIPFFSFLVLVGLSGVGFAYYAKDISCTQITSIAGLDCFRLYLAFGVLFAVAVLLAVSAAFYALLPPPAQGEHPGKQIFDTMAKSLLPIVTFVLGYYFGSSQTASQSAQTTSSAPAKQSTPAPGSSSAGSQPLAR